MRRRTARCGRSGSAAAGRPGLSTDPRTSRYPHASPAIERRPGLSVAARSAASRCGISCAHRGQVTGLPASPGSAAASIASAQARAAAASCAGSRSRTMAWVSRCITSPRWSMRASDCQASRRRVCCQASGSAARAASSPGRSPGTLVNRSSGTGSGARNAHTPASWAAAGSSSASRSAISPVAAASDCGYDPGIASSSSCPARVASRSRYWTALMPVSAMNPPACTTANGRSPSCGRQPVRIIRAEPGHPVVQEGHRFVPCQHVDLDRRGDFRPRPLPGGNQHMARPARQPPGDISGFFGVVEDQQPPPPLAQVGQHRPPAPPRCLPPAGHSRARRPGRRTGRRSARPARR